jgi:hypothetical protein
MIGNPIIKKSLVCGIICLFVISGIVTGASGFDEIVDQHQDNFNPYSGYAISINQTLAQSFKPSMTPLIKVDLALGKASSTIMPVIVSIRNDLEGNDLTSITVPADQIPTEVISWYSFDFPDIIVIPENTYYIVVKCNAAPLYGYALGIVQSNTVDEYPRGTAWAFWEHSAGNWSWSPLEGPNFWYDYAFKTYSSNQPPNPPTISGPHYGKINTEYTFSLGPITDPDGDQFYGLWDWGDGNPSGWLGPYGSGQTVSNSHAWSEPGNYSIKVKIKDIWGAVSDWSDPFFIEIVQLKTAFFLGTFKSINQTDDLIIMQARSFIVFPSNSIFYKGRTIVLSKDYHGCLRTTFTLGVGGIVVL